MLWGMVYHQPVFTIDLLRAHSAEDGCMWVSICTAEGEWRLGEVEEAFDRGGSHRPCSQGVVGTGTILYYVPRWLPYFRVRRSLEPTRRMRRFWLGLCAARPRDVDARIAFVRQRLLETHARVLFSRPCAIYCKMAARSGARRMQQNTRQPCALLVNCLQITYLHAEEWGTGLR